MSDDISKRIDEYIYEICIRPPMYHSTICSLVESISDLLIVKHNNSIIHDMQLYVFLYDKIIGLYEEIKLYGNTKYFLYNLKIQEFCRISNITLEKFSEVLLESVKYINKYFDNEIFK